MNHRWAGSESVAGCPFCEIIAGGLRYRLVYRDDDVAVLTDIAPINEGHLLVVPTLMYPRWVPPSRA